MGFYWITDDLRSDIESRIKRARPGCAADYNAAAKGGSPLRIDNGTAFIDIVGVLEPKRVAAYDYWDIEHTAYEDIQAQMVEAVAKGAKKAVLNISSGGGNNDGLLQLMKSIAAMEIPTEGKISSVAASAAFMIGSQTDVLVASSESDIVGSNGVVTGRHISDDYKEITNTESPEKRPDASEPEGVKAIQKFLDDVYGLTVPYIAAGRNTTVEKVNSDFGRGNVMTAKTALAKGMIDAIDSAEPAPKPTNKPAGSNSAQESNGRKAMTKDELRAQHPDLYAAIHADGKEAGKSEYKEHAEVHLELAKTSGDYERATADIAEMKAAGPAAMLHHNQQAMKRLAIENRGGETVESISSGEETDLAPEKEKTDAEGSAKVFAEETGFEVDYE